MVKAGQFALVERCGYEGGVPERLREIIIEAGGDEEDVSYALNMKEEQVLGYIPVTERRSADAFAGIVHIGATWPVSRQEVVEAIEGFREAAIDRLRKGDAEAGALAGTWQKLADFWRGQPPSKDAIDRISGWLRWILVLPCAGGGYVVIQLVVAVIHGIAELVGALSPVVSLMGDYFPQFVNSVAGPYVFVWVGTRMAPAYRTGCTKDHPALWMSPPAAEDRLPSNSLGQGRNGTLAALKDNSVLFYECEDSIRG